MTSEGGRTRIWIDGESGHALHFEQLLGATPADRITTWFTLLHMAEVFGLPYRLATSGIGLLVAMLSVSGVLVWIRKRSARRHAHRS